MYIPCKIWDTYTKRNLFTSNLVLISYHFKLPVFKDIIFKSRLNTKYNLNPSLIQKETGSPNSWLSAHSGLPTYHTYKTLEAFSIWPVFLDQTNRTNNHYTSEGNEKHQIPNLQF